MQYNATSRIKYIDILETIAIYFICFIHYPILRGNWFNNFVDCLAYSGVIIFFFVNGALLLNKPLDFKKHFKRILKMAGVLFVWEIISIFYFANLYHLDLNTVQFSDVVSYLIGGIRWIMPTGHFWFIIALIAIYCIFPIIKIAFDNKEVGTKVLIAFICSVILFNFIPADLETLQLLLNKCFASVSLNIEWSLLNSFGIINHARLSSAITFFIIGGLLHRYFYVEKKSIKFQVLKGCLLILTSWIVLYLLKGIHTGFTGDKFASLPWAYNRLCSIALGIGWFLCIVPIGEVKSKIFDKLFNLISMNTLGIFYLHCLFLGFVSYYLYQYIHPCCLANILKSFVVLFLCLFVCILCKKIPVIKNIF